MVSGWGPPFFTAVTVTGLAVPWLRRLALTIGFVDRPGGHKSHAAPVPYLGGVGLIAGVLGGMVVTADPGVHAVMIAFGTAVLGSVGLIDDHRTVDPFIRLFVQLSAASVPILLGLRVSVTGVAALDAVLTLVWIVGIINAFNLLDNMDGLSAGTAMVAATTLLLLAILSGNGTTAAAAAAVVGACAAFLVYNRRPASIFMGDTGSLFLGFVIAVLAIEVTPGLRPPTSFLIPLLIVGLPMLDTLTVSLARLRRGRSILRGGRDHLSHRLVALGLSPGVAVAVLVSIEGVLGGCALACARGLVPVWLAVVVAVLVLLALSWVTGRARVYEEVPTRWPASRVLAAGGGLAAITLLIGRAVSGLSLAGRTAARSAGSSTPLTWCSLAAAAVAVASTLAVVARVRLQPSRAEPSSSSR